MEGGGKADSEVCVQGKNVSKSTIRSPITDGILRCDSPHVCLSRKSYDTNRRAPAPGDWPLPAWTDLSPREPCHRGPG
jgi:hypothetical protein